MTRPERVLILGEYPIGYANGIGETFANLFARHSDAELFQLYPQHHQPVPGQQRGRPATFDLPRPPASWPRAATVAYRPILKLRQSAAQRRVVDDAAALIRERGITAVLTYPTTPWMLFAAVQLRRSFPDVRFVFYVMDDWEGFHTCFGLPFTAKRRAALAEMIATADARFACSHLMKADYEQRFATSWDVLHKGVPLAPLPPASHAPIANILYTGAMNMFRFDAVKAFAAGMQRARERFGVALTLTLLGPLPDREYAEALAPYEFIRTEPWIDNDACQLRMTHADALYLPLSFAPKLQRIADLAMPTKFPEYLASGRPTIFHVPAASEVQLLASRAGLPLTLNTLDPDAIAAFLSALVRQPIDAAGYQSRASQLLRDEFDETVLRRRLQRALFDREADRC